MTQILPRELVWETGIAMYTDFFPAGLRGEMEEAALSQIERKVLYGTLGGELFPEPFDTAARLVVESGLASAINTLIVKRYEVGEPSTAFDFHHDPEEYDGRLVLASLGGLATLTVLDLNVGQIELQCRPNTVISLPAYGIPKLHRVTMPIPDHGTRPFAFFGHHSHDH